MTFRIAPLSFLLSGVTGGDPKTSTFSATNSSSIPNDLQSNAIITSPTPYADEDFPPMRFDQSQRLVCSTARGLRHAADGIGLPVCVRHLEFTKSALDSCYVVPSRFASFFKILGSARRATSLTIDCIPCIDFFDDSIPTRLWIRETLFRIIADMPDLALLSLPFLNPDCLVDMADDNDKDWTLWQVRYFSIISKEFGTSLNRYLLALTMICPNLTHVSYTIQPRDNILKTLKSLILPRTLQTFIVFVPHSHRLCPTDPTSGQSLQEELRKWVGDHRIVLLRVHATHHKEVYRHSPGRLAFERGLLSLKGCAGSNLDGLYPDTEQDEIWAVADDIVRRRKERKTTWEEGASIRFLEDVDMAM
ncbi:hypothetical protein CYLTODRAFT_447799 [Cylindrobasidium torrendii FP15055 ss-10]|uniref:Uncharacterized protein n=1 Tax=Cylindrobasidium torrendii FP15055 ss-10 TaxID=1314674 RepID=A0A0D7AVA8_9AGAR|nr:hypothetical protein CYLTODRAFT_447799 [Cylindrobasidium torrendii FP15055 ss-10]